MDWPVVYLRVGCHNSVDCHYVDFQIEYRDVYEKEWTPLHTSKQTANPSMKNAPNRDETNKARQIGEPFLRNPQGIEPRFKV